MRDLISLILLLVVAWSIHLLAASGEVDPFVRGAMSIGLLMIGAYLAGALFARIRLPRISGYLIFGILLGPSFWQMVTGSDEFALIGPAQVSGKAPALQFVSDLAIALIALTAGGEIKLRWLKDQLGRISIITGIKLLGVWTVLSVAVFFFESMIPGVAEAPLELRIVMALLVGLVAAANSPAVVMALINETGARGPLSQTTLAVTIAKDMAMVVLFAAALAIGKGVLDEQTTISGTFLIAVAVQLLGSLLIGVLLGLVMAWYVHRVNDHLLIFVIGSCLFIALLGEQYFTITGQTVHLEPLLIALAAGLLLENLWPEQSEPLFQSIESMSLPVYCGFFAVAGAKLNLATIVDLWMVVLGLVLLRAGAVWLTVTGAARLTACDPAWRNKLWLGFLPQAGIALALATIIAKAFPDLPAAQKMNEVLIGMVAINEIVGPIGLRWSLTHTGEADSEGSAGQSTPQ